MYSITPNQCGYGCLLLDEIREKFNEIEQLPNVAWACVALHDDTKL